jgi:hypothetical protein
MADICKNVTTLESIKKVPIPAQTSSYKPVSHAKLVDLTLDGASKAGFSVNKESYLSARNGNIVTAYYDLNYLGDKEMGMRIAWQNSYNKAVTLKFAIGGNVFVCSNGCFSGSLGAFRKKHTGNVQTFTPEKIFEYFKTAQDSFDVLVKEKNKLKQIEIDPKVRAQIIGDLYLNEGVLKETQIAIIKKEIENPSFTYGEDAVNSAWETYNHITHSLKTIPPSDYIDSHTGVHNYFVNSFGIILQREQGVLEFETA